MVDFKDVWAFQCGAIMTVTGRGFVTIILFSGAPVLFFITS